MDALAIILAIGALIVAIIALERSKDSLRQFKSLESQFAALREELRHLTERIYGLEKRETVQSPKEVVNETAGEGMRPSPAPSQTKVPVPLAGSSWPASRPLSEPIPSSFPTRRPAEPVSSQSKPQPLPVGSSAPTPKAPQPERHRLAEMEERLGTNWLNKIGTAAFVIGVALLLNYSMHYLGPAGKIGLGYALSAVLLAIGVFAERKERYRIAGRAVLGGGWALVYFTTYAMHNIAAVRIVRNPGLGFALLFIVAAAMVAHSLLYNSEVTTGFAYLLAFVSVGVSHIPIGALAAAVLLAASLAVVLRVRHWYVIEPFAIVATYVLHWMWLNQIYTEIGGHRPFPQFAASLALLTGYWLVYLASYFLRGANNRTETQLLTASFLLNAAGYFLVLHEQAFHPAWRFWFLLGAGAVYLCISAFSKRTNRRLSFILASTLGVALMLAAVPYRYSGGSQEILWLIEIEAFLIAGWRLPDGHLRRLAWAGSGVLGGYVAAHDLIPRFLTWQAPNPKVAWLLVALAAAFYVNSRLPARKELDDSTETDKIALAVSPAIATGFALAAAWIGLWLFWPAVVWTLLAVALMEVGRYSEDRVLRLCGHVSAVFAVLRLLSINLFEVGFWHNINLRLLTVALSCALFYLSALRMEYSSAGAENSTHDTILRWWLRCGGISGVYTAVATLLMAILLWDEITNAAVALAWGLLGLALFEASRSLRPISLRIQAYLILTASFARLFIADLNSSAYWGPIPTPVVTVGLLAAIYYYIAVGGSEFPRIRITLLWFGTISLVALLRFELLSEWVAVGWTALAVALYILGRWLKSATLSDQCYAITILAGVRCAFDNFYETERWHFTTIRIATVVAAAVLMYGLFVAAQFSKTGKRGNLSAEGSRRTGWVRWLLIWDAVANYPRRLFFLVPTILITVLISLEVRRGFLTASWGLEALLIFLIVLKMDERLYRWFSLLLFLLCVGRVLTVDVWNLDALGRIVSFLGLGAALLAVSFLYARHRELLRRVL